MKVFEAGRTIRVSAKKAPGEKESLAIWDVHNYQISGNGMERALKIRQSGRKRAEKYPVTFVALVMGGMNNLAIGERLIIITKP